MHSCVRDIPANSRRGSAHPVPPALPLSIPTKFRSGGATRLQRQPAWCPTVQMNSPAGANPNIQRARAPRRGDGSTEIWRQGTCRWRPPSGGYRWRDDPAPFPPIFCVRSRIRSIPASIRAARQPGREWPGIGIVGNVPFSIIPPLGSSAIPTSGLPLLNCDRPDSATRLRPLQEPFWLARTNLKQPLTHPSVPRAWSVTPDLTCVQRNSGWNLPPLKPWRGGWVSLR
jgi:hypothetical protein